MMNTWENCKNILCIRLDNMGDLLMSSPAIAALKETFNCKITVLTSSMAKEIASVIPVIDDCIVYDVPWVKSAADETTTFQDIVNLLRNRNFDAAVLFTVFSQNPLPAAMLAYLAGIPKRLAYCRENPYDLLTQWVPDEEPYTFIRHQVKRDLDLVSTIGAKTKNDNLRVNVNQDAWQISKQKLINAGVDINKPWIVFHPGVSEKKREYPIDQWIEAGKKIKQLTNFQILITGAPNEKNKAEAISKSLGDDVHTLAGHLNLTDFIFTLERAALIISVNTSTIHIASALRKKIVVLYALTNPQHTPWKCIGKILSYSIPEDLQSKNEVLRFLHKSYFRGEDLAVSADDIANAVKDILIHGDNTPVPELVLTSPHLLV